jgi:hypothetical protein
MLLYFEGAQPLLASLRETVPLKNDRIGRDDKSESEVIVMNTDWRSKNS